MENREKQEKVKQKYLEIQLLQQHLQEVQQQLQIFEQQSTELERINEGLESVQKEKKKQMFSQLGAGVFLQTELKDNKNVIMNVGSDIFVSKPINEAMELIKKNITETEKIIKKIKEQLSKAQPQLSSLQHELRELANH